MNIRTFSPSILLGLIAIFLSGFFASFPGVAMADFTGTKQFSLGLIDPLNQVADNNAEYINPTDLSLAVNFEVPQTEDIYSLGLFVDDLALPQDEVLYDKQGAYLLTSQTHTASELQTLIPEGNHKIYLKYRTTAGSSYESIWSKKIICDYTSPHGIFEAIPQSPKTLIIGDWVDIKFTPNFHSQNTKTIESLIYGRELKWHKVTESSGESYFLARYTIDKNDPSVRDYLVLENLKMTDLAGNTTDVLSQKVAIDFEINTEIPKLVLGTSNLSGSVEQGSNIELNGTSDPGAEIVLTVNSTPQTISTIADIKGNWRILFDTSNLEIGSHNATLTAISLAGNQTTINLGYFQIISEQAENQPVIQIAQSTETESKSDVRPAVVAHIPQSQVTSVNQGDTQLATSGRTSSAEDVKTPSVNWSAWILLLAMVVLASALATAGYYGYGWLTIRQSGQTKIEKIAPKEENPIEYSKNIDEGKEEPPALKDDEPPKTRW